MESGANTMTNNITGTLSAASDSSLEKNSTSYNSLSLSSDPVSEETVDLVTVILSCHVNPLISLCGIVGNVLNIVVFLMQKRSRPMNSLLIVLAAVDACYLVFVNLEFLACSIRRYDVIAARNFTIMTLPHLIWIAVILSRISSMLTVVISAERCLVVMIPLKVKLIVTPLTIHITTALACIIPTLAHIPLFLRGEVQWILHKGLNITLPYLKLTEFALKNSHFMNLYKNLILNVLFRYVTMGIISVCTGFTIAQLRRYSRWRLNSITSQSDRSAVSERDTRVSMTMRCIMLTLRLIEPQFDFYGVYKNSFDLARELGNFFTVINSSSNFIIYMRGGDEFRQTFVKNFRGLFSSYCTSLLFRCLMRGDQGPSKQACYSSSVGALGNEQAGKRGTAGKLFTKFTNVSSFFSATSTQTEDGVCGGDQNKTREL